VPVHVGTGVPNQVTRPAPKPIQVPGETARRFLAARHLLAPARSVRGGPEAVMEVVRRLGSVQFDPLAVAGRNHDLVLHARVADYDTRWTESLLYEKRSLFEAYNKGLSLLPADELPWYRVAWTQARHSTGILAENAELADRVVERIRADGPLTARDFESGRTTNWFGTPMSVSTAVLDGLTATGVLGLAKRDGNRRAFDLVERLYPPALLAREVPREEQMRHKFLSRYRGHGLLGVASPAMLGLGDAGERTAMRERLIASGELVRVQIEGVRRARHVFGEEVDLLQDPPDPVPSVAFIAPLDPLAWDPKFLLELYGFNWVWEVYLPPARRRWGYYVLPVHYRDRMVGRIEPRIDRPNGRVNILGLMWEEDFDPAAEEGFVDAMRDALHAYIRFAGASELSWPPHLDREKSLFDVRT